MTSKEFILWLKGFADGVHEYNVTPKQWDIVKEKLAEVEDKVLGIESPSFPIYPKQPITTHPHYIVDTPISQPVGSSLSTTSNNRWSEYQTTMAQYRPYQPYTTGGEDEIVKHHNED